MTQSVCMTTMSPTADDLGTLLRMWRAGADLSIAELSEAASKLLPGSLQIGRETVRRYERGIFPAGGPQPYVLAAIAIACGRRIGDLPDHARSDVGLLTELLSNHYFPLSRLVAA